MTSLYILLQLLRPGDLHGLLLGGGNDSRDRCRRYNHTHFSIIPIIFTNVGP